LEEREINRDYIDLSLNSYFYCGVTVMDKTTQG
jgi:hypothetical protein